MKRAPFRSLLFMALFPLVTAVMCIALLPTLLLPRRYYMATVHAFVMMVDWLERIILNLRYEVRGLENLPQSGAYIVAAKHQSAYETLKLHMLWHDPAVILKKELLSIPLWGQYLKKSDVIAIDRSSKETAMQSIADGARRMMAQGRPIIIFPQGTRVGVEETTKDKPYRAGVARAQEATGLPIIPLAMNSGMFWPRGGWLKSSGCVVFKFLEPITPGKERAALLSELEEKIEGESLSLMNEAREKSASRKSNSLIFIVVLLGLFTAYSYAWMETAKIIKLEYPRILADLSDATTPVAPPRISGYPGKIKAFVASEKIQSANGAIKVENLSATGWPIPGLPINIQTGSIEIQNMKWKKPLVFDALNAQIIPGQNTIHVINSLLIKGDFQAAMRGDIDLRQEPFPLLDLQVTLQNHPSFIQNLIETGALKERAGLFISAGLVTLADAQGIVNVAITQRGQTVFVGPVPIMTIPVSRPKLLDSANLPAPAP